MSSSSSSHNRRRSDRLFGLGIRVAGIGTCIVAIYFFFVSESPIPGLRETLSWVIPVGILFWVLALGLVLVGLVVRSAEGPAGESRSLSFLASAQNACMTGGFFRGRLAALYLGAAGRFRGLFPLHWTPSFLQSLDGNILVCVGADLFREMGFRAVFANRAEGIADILLYQGDESRPTGAVLCLSGGSGPIREESVRQFYLSLSKEGIEYGVVMTTGFFSDKARSFGEGKSLELLSGQDLLAKLRDLSDESSGKILQQAARRMRERRHPWSRV